MSTQCLLILQCRGCSEWCVLSSQVPKNEGFCYYPPLLVGLLDKSFYIWLKAGDSWMKEISVIFSSLTQLLHLPLHSALEINQNGKNDTSESILIAVYVSANTPWRPGLSCSAMKPLQS